MQQQKTILLLSITTLLLTACSSLFPVSRQPERPIHCISSSQALYDQLLIQKGLICTANNNTTPFPITTRLITDLSYPLFTEHTRNSGVNNPLDFWQKGYAGLYQINHPISERVIIYINGYNGRPTGWKSVYTALNKLPLTHIFFNYPTGDSLETTSSILAAILTSNAERLQNKHITLLAHSQGGLIAIRTTQIIAQSTPNITINHIITTATPWQGCNLAGYAQLINPISPKVFEDIDSNSKFLAKVKQTPLPQQTRYTLVYATTFNSTHTTHATDGLFSRINQCETGSKLTPDQQFGIISSHSGVLHCKQFLKLIRQVTP